MQLDTIIPTCFAGRIAGYDRCRQPGPAGPSIGRPVGRSVDPRRLRDRRRGTARTIEPAHLRVKKKRRKKETERIPINFSSRRGECIKIYRLSLFHLRMRDRLYIDSIARAYYKCPRLLTKSIVARRFPAESRRHRDGPFTSLAF